MHDDLGLLSRRAEAVVDEIDFGLYHRQVVLRSTLQYETRSQRREIRDAGNIEKYVLRQDDRHSGKNLLRPPTLPLEVHDVRLHEHRAPVTKHRHGLRGKSEIGIL